MTEIGRLLSAAKGFNTNLVHVLPSHHVTISKITSALLNAWFARYTDVHLKLLCVHEILRMKNYNL